MTGSFLVRLLNLGISVYSCHTPFDKLKGGNNDFLAELIGLEEIRGFSDGPEENRIGRTGYLSSPMTLVSMMDLLADRLDMDPEQIVDMWSSYMGLEDPAACGDQNPLMETTPYFKNMFSVRERRKKP